MAGSDCPQVVRVLPDVVGIDREFDYTVPDEWRADGRAARLAVGSMVRVVLSGRRVSGWVTELDVDPPNDVELSPLAHLRGMGPPHELLDLAAWAAWRWAGKRVHFLRAASPGRPVPAPMRPRRPRATGAQPPPLDARPSVPASPPPGPLSAGPSPAQSQHHGLPPGGDRSAESSLRTKAATLPLCSAEPPEAQSASASSTMHAQEAEPTADPGAEPARPAAHSGDLADAFGRGRAVVRTLPGDDGAALARAACSRGDALILVPDAEHALRLARAIERHGVNVARGLDDWALAAAGATVVGTASAAWAPMPNLAAVLVVDEHDERFKSTKTPAWHARDVALERAERRGVPIVLCGPVPSLEALRVAPMLRPERSVERAGWPVAEVLDRREDSPGNAGPFSDRLAPLLRRDGRVVCVLNRKGRSRLLACAQCKELVRSADGSAAMLLDGDELRSPDGSERRPVVCAECGATKLKNLRMGVTRAAEELAALLREPVGEATATSARGLDRRVLIGTEAVLHRVETADVVAFLDFDQELLAVRQRAWEQALVLLARAARILGPRSGPGRLVLQTRQPSHVVVRAAAAGDPSLVAVAERDRRRALRLAPYGAQAAVSGAGAGEFMAAFGSPEGVRVLGPLGDRWLLRSAEHRPLLDALQATPRPAGRLRVEVDPQRV